MKNKTQKKKVFVGLSGGVDSSVSAALLKQKGYEVTGVFIKGWYPDWQECNWRGDRRDAMRVCAKLGIPFLTLDLEKEYKKGVVDYMIAEYKKGRTPNPDVMCNKEIKFGAFLKHAKKLGADFVATGHYTKNKNLTNNKFQLQISADTNKDQSYFLWTLGQNELKNILFPVGELTKPEVRRLAKKFNLATAEKKDSQGLCFIGKIDMADFLEHYIKRKKGAVLDASGRKIGVHNGAVFLTIGQRHGFTLNNKTTKSLPHYIVQKNIKANTITVSTKKTEEISSLGSKNIELTDTSWVLDKPEKGKDYQVRLRYRQTLLPAQIFKKGKVWIVSLSKAQIDIPIGQSLVIYDGPNCIGGGIIEKSY